MMGDHFDESVAPRRFTLLNMTGFVGIALLLATALVATWIPTRQGTRIDPMLAMRAE
jgi:ABC-type lipoprotein release transport system permease subunit